MTRPDYSIQDVTHDHSDAISFEDFADSAVKAMARQIEELAKGVAYSRGSTTEQGAPHVAYCNGVIKAQGEGVLPWPVNGFSVEQQIETTQQCMAATIEAIKANKPPAADLLIWREEPWVSRYLRTDGLPVTVYARLSWERYHGKHDR